MLNNTVALLESGAAAAVGDYESISTVTVGAGGQASVAFSSIPSTYKHLQIRAISRGSAGQLGLVLNSDTATNYSYHQLSGNGASTFATAGVTQNKMLLNFNTATSTTYNLALVIDILDYADTNKYKTIRTLSGIDQNGSGTVQLVSGSWRSTSATNALTFTDTGGNIAQYSSFALYGIK